MKLDKLDEPLNLNERYMYGINIRLNILIEQFNSFLNAYANDKKIATTSEIIKDVKVDKSEATEEVVSKVKRSK